jgi:hypothetical protein
MVSMKRQRRKGILKFNKCGIEMAGYGIKAGQSRKHREKAN